MAIAAGGRVAAGNFDVQSDFRTGAENDKEPPVIFRAQ
jgi:hypothetical protein